MEQFAKVVWKPGTLLYPLPAVLVACGAMDGPRNLLTVAWTGIVCSEPAMCHVSIRPERHSHAMIRRGGEFSVNLTTSAMVRAVDWCGVKSGRDVDKFAGSGLTPVPASRIAAPLVAESPLSLECRVVEVRPLGSHDLFLAEIVAVQAADAFIRANSGAFDPTVGEPLCFCHGRYYALGRPLGRFGFSVEKPGTKRKRLARQRSKTRSSS
jgi:flavin reductase (DIM6/NTAB) family NADH-FMN oxidoreductase RutF